MFGEVEFDDGGVIFEVCEEGGVGLIGAAEVDVAPVGAGEEGLDEHAAFGERFEARFFLGGGCGAEVGFFCGGGEGESAHEECGDEGEWFHRG